MKGILLIYWSGANCARAHWKCFNSSDLTFYQPSTHVLENML